MVQIQTVLATQLSSQISNRMKSEPMFGESKQMDELIKELKVARAQLAVFRESIMRKMKEVMSELGIVCDELDTDSKKRNCLEALRRVCEEKYQRLLEWFSDKKGSNS